MKLFITKMFQFFVLLTIIGLSIPIAVNIWLNKKAEFVIPNVSELAVFGHSHPECAFNDELINNFSNFSASGESYFYTLMKAKELVNHNKQIKTVFIEFSNDQINKNINEWIWSDEHLSARYHTFSPFMSLKDHFLIFNNNMKGFFKYLHISTKKNVKRIKNKNYLYQDKVGKYKKLTGVTKSSFTGENKSNEKYISEVELSLINITYLKELLFFLKKEGKQVLLIRSPLRENNSFQKNEPFFKSILSKQFSEIDFLDFVDFPLEDKDFYDYGHLNVNGAEKFSTWFNGLLEKGLLDTTNKQNFINRQIEIYKIENEIN